MLSKQWIAWDSMDSTADQWYNYGLQYKQETEPLKSQLVLLKT